MVNLSSTEYLHTVSLDEPCVEEARAAVAAVLERNMEAPRALLESYAEFQELVSSQVATGRAWEYYRMHLKRPSYHHIN